MDNPAWNRLHNRFSVLLTQPITPETAPALLGEWESLDRQAYQYRAELVRAYYAHTTDEAAKAAHDSFVKDHYPELTDLSDRFLRKLAVSSVKYPKEWEHFVTSVNPEESSEELLALLGEETQLGRSFQKIRASTTYIVDGQETTPGALAAKLQHPDREERKKAYLGLIGSEHGKDRELLQLFVKLHGLRTRIAHVTGYGNYYEYITKRGRLRAKAYTPEDTHVFRSAVRKHILPLFLKIREQRKILLGLDQLRPWDTMVNPFGITPMADFSSESDALDKTGRTLERFDKEFYQIFSRLREENLIDVESRPDKARNGYASIMPETGQPFLIMHIGPRPFNIHLLFHELGHTLHYAMIPERSSSKMYAMDLEFSEFVSQTIELLTAPFLNEFFKTEELPIVYYLLLERICHDIIMMCKLDEFQEVIYQMDHLTEQLAEEIYDEIDSKYQVGVTWGDAGYLRPYFWKNYTLFSEPFYRFEYAVAWVAALQVQTQYQQAPKEALDRLKQGMRLGNSRPPRELFQLAGVDLTFDEELLARAAADLEGRLAASSAMLGHTSSTRR